MNGYLLDTNVVSELRRNKPHGAVLAWLQDLRDDQIFLSAVSLGEIQAGIEHVRQQDPRKADEIEAWLERVAASYRILSMDVPCFREWGRLMHKKQAELMEDAMIAATARVHGLTIASRNARDFAALGVAVVNPFQTM